MSSSSDRVGPPALAGLLRGYAVHGATFPMLAVRTGQQDSPVAHTAYQVAKMLYQEGGIKRFYRGFPIQLIEKTISQPITFIGLVHGSSLINRHISHPIAQQAVLGIGIAAVNSAITNPLERTRVLTVLNRGNISLIFKFYTSKEGWVGFRSNLANSANRWSVFCVAQDQFTRRERAKVQRPLNLFNYAMIALKTSFVVSLAGAATEVVTVKAMSREEKLRKLIAQGQFRQFFRGLPLGWACMFTHNITTIALIDYFKR